MLKIEYLEETEDVYDITVEDNHNFYANKILVHNCQEITLPTKPLTHPDDPDGEIALCILSALNVGRLKSLDEVEGLTDLAVRSLDEIVDLQEYPILAAKNSTLNRRSLGIGVIGLAHYLAKNKVTYSSPDSIPLVDELMECMQFNLLKASNNLAKEKGPCGYFDRTKYSQGILPIDTYKPFLDTICDRPLSLDWEGLRADIKEHGLRNSTLSAQMPSESSSVVSNATNGMEPPRALMSQKKSKKGILKQVVPDFQTLGKYYETSWEMENNTGYMNIMGIAQKYMDQAISSNQYYDYSRYPDNNIPLSVVVKDILYAYKIGLKTLYYLNTYDGKSEENDSDQGCAGGGCSI
jgi:ribonucleoside-diphosphate reductase alpha chain